MNPSYVGAVWMFGGNFAPYGFQFCDGSLMSIADNEVLYVLLGTTYGGDGVQTFGLPDLRGRCVVGQGQGPGLSPYVNGQISGTETVSISTQQMGGHSHLLNAGTNATQQAPASNMYINQVMNSGATANFFSDQAASATLIPSTLSATGSNIPINIIQPSLVITYVITLYGIYPSQN